MEPKRIKFNLDANREVYVSIPSSWAQSQQVAEEKPNFFQQSRSFSEAVEVIRPIVDQVMEPLNHLQRTPDEIELNFGFSFGANSELIMQNQEAHSHIQISLRFRKETT